MSGHLLCGALGGPNFGDEIILSGWIDTIRRHDPDARLFCDGFDNDNLGAFVAGRAQVLTTEESLWHTLHLFDFGRADQWAWPTITESLATPAIIDAAVRLAQALRAHDIARIHFVGGGYFNALWPWNYALLVLARLIAWSAGMRIVATGQGLCPTNSLDRAGLAELLATFDHVDVRDLESLHLLAPASHITCSGDDALLHFASPAPAAVRPLEVPALVVCLQQHLYDAPRAFEAVARAITHPGLAASGIRHLILLEAAPGDITAPDAGIAARCRDAGWTCEAVRSDALLRDGLPVHPAGIMVTSRYHPHLLAMLAGARGIALAENAYYETKHAAVHRAGSNWPVLSGDPTERFAEALDHVLSADFQPRRPQLGPPSIQAKQRLAQTLYGKPVSRTGFPIDTITTLGRLLQRERAAADATSAEAEARRVLAETLERERESERALRRTLDEERQLRAQEAASLAEERRLRAQETAALAEERQVRAQVTAALAEERRLRAHEAADRAREHQARLEAEAHVARLRGSLSWRLTRPLRRLKRMLRPT